MLCVLIDYGSGNLRSAAKAFEHSAPEDCTIEVTSDPKRVEQATHIVLPGVGAFADCMRGLKAVKNMREVLEQEVIGKHKPFLGICVGMQMLFERGHENGVHEGLGWIAGEVVKIGAMPGLKIPHMGWNDLKIEQPDHPLVQGIGSGDHAYFVHSYHAQCRDANAVIATVEYGAAINAIVAKENIMGTQFHPEKSQATGLRLIENFLRL